jgi:DNA-binding transcriptional LysR family regulator
MDLKRLRYFCAVAEQGSMTKAAEILHIAQPALSKRLQELEEELETQLLTRNGREMVLTGAGAFLYQRACLILRNVADTQRETQLFARHQKRTLRLGVSYLYERFFTPLMVKLVQQNPQLELRVSVSDSSHLEFLLNQGSLDVILVQAPKQTEGYKIISFPSPKLVAVIHNSLLADESVYPKTFKDVVQYPLILLHRIDGPGIFEYLLDQIRKEGIQPNILMHVSQPRLQLDMLESGIAGAALLPISEVNAYHLRHCQVLQIQPSLAIFTPAIVTRSTGADIQELEQVIHSMHFSSYTDFE